MKKKKNKALYMSVGSVVLIIGMTLNLMWWNEFMIILKGLSGFVIAFAGLLTLYLIKE